MPALQILNIRNLPPIEHPTSWPGMDPTIEGLATAIVERLTNATLIGRKKLQPLRTIAIGSLTHGDYRLGSAPRGSLADIYQRRTYNIEYCKHPRGDTVPLLTLMAKGCTCTDHATKDIGVLQPYWLG